MYTVLSSDGNQYGPVDLNTIQQWIREGRVVPDTVILDGVTGNRGPASQFPLIAPHLNQGSAPAPYQPQVINQVHQPGGQYPQVGAYTQPPNPYAQYPRPGMPGGVNHYPKQKIVAALLAFFLGGLGVHKFYLGKNTLGIIMLVTSIGLGILTCGIASIVVSIWAFVDFILILCDKETDVNGYPLV
ncbi:MAG: NINE protein [Fimbriimonadaceae bacterium]|nr:MAG: NINE protein [Fimbriimonadaceae bacterium]